MDISSMSPISVRNCTLDSYLLNSENTEIIGFLSRVAHYLMREVLPTGPWPSKPRILVDVKFHDLQVDQIPAIPGWHIDGSSLAQPEGPRERYLLYVCGPSAMTEFCMSQLEVPAGQEGKAKIAEYEAPYYECFKLSSGDFISYDSRQMHRATPAEESGKRLLIRIMHSDTIPGLPYERAIFNPTIR
jgi:hypothetical protein